MAHDLWRTDLTKARERLARLSPSDKVAIALHDFAGVEASDVVPFDYADGPNGVRGHRGATAFPSMLALAASFDRRLAAAYGIALAREVLAAGRNAVFSPGLDVVRVPWGGWHRSGIRECLPLLRMVDVHRQRGEPTCAPGT